MIALVVFFVLGALADALTMQWHRARERKRVYKVAGLSMLLELLSWAPLWIAIQTDRIDIALASIVGSGVGTAWGMKRALPEK